MKICADCRKLFEDDSVPKIVTDLGFETGVGWLSCPCESEECDVCGGEIVDATKCAICDEWFYDTDNCRVCAECLRSNITLESAFALGDYNKDKVSINGFFASVFTPAQIEELCIKEWKAFQGLYSTRAEAELKRYLFEDVTCFAAVLEDKAK